METGKKPHMPDFVVPGGIVRKTEISRVVSWEEIQEEISAWDASGVKIRFKNVEEGTTSDKVSYYLDLVAVRGQESDD